MTLCFFDTEFLQNGSGKVELVSIGIVRDDGQTFYRESSDFNEASANDWVKANVFPKLGPMDQRKTRAQIRDDLVEWMGELIPTWVAYNASYDGVCLFELFGTFDNLPKGWPNDIWDLKQDRLRVGKPDLPNQDAKGEHNALTDAMWLKDAYYFLHGRFGVTIPQQRPLVSHLEAIDTYRAIMKAMGHDSMVEMIGDNTVDNLISELTRCTTIELGHFAAGLMHVSVNKFEYAYETPHYDEFKAALTNLINRYKVMDGLEQGDTCMKMLAMMKDIFTSNYGALGPEAADAMATQYAQHMIDFIKSQNLQAADLASSMTPKIF